MMSAVTAATVEGGLGIVHPLPGARHYRTLLRVRHPSAVRAGFRPGPRKAADHGASAYAARAAAARPLARGQSGCFAWNSICTAVAVSSAERPSVFSSRARACTPSMIARLVAMIEPSPAAPSEGTTVLGRIASNASNAASHAWANSDSCTVEFTYFADAGDAR